MLHKHNPNIKNNFILKRYICQNNISDFKIAFLYYPKYQIKASFTTLLYYEKVKKITD